MPSKHGLNTKPWHDASGYKRHRLAGNSSRLPVVCKESVEVDFGSSNRDSSITGHC